MLQFYDTFCETQPMKAPAVLVFALMALTSIPSLSQQHDHHKHDTQTRFDHSHLDKSHLEEAHETAENRIEKDEEHKAEGHESEAVHHHQHAHPVRSADSVLANTHSIIAIPEALALPEPEYPRNKGPRVLASIHPLALMAASLVPPSHLSTLLPPGMTPHDFALKPSDIDLILDADIILWTGPDSEPYLRGLAKRWPDKTWVDVSEAGQNGDITNPHWWLSPELIGIAQQRLARQLGTTADAFQTVLDFAVSASFEQLTPVREKGFLVYHNAFDHWVSAMQLNQLGAFLDSPEHSPGFRSMFEKRQLMSSGDVHCIFTEPEFPTRLIDRLTEGKDIPRAELDAIALHIPISANAYPEYLLDMASRVYECLSQSIEEPSQSEQGADQSDSHKAISDPLYEVEDAAQKAAEPQQGDRSHHSHSDSLQTDPAHAH